MEVFAPPVDKSTSPVTLIVELPQVIEQGEPLSYWKILVTLSVLLLVINEP